MKKFFDFLFRSRKNSARAHMRQVKTRDFFKQVYANRTAMVGVVILTLFILVALIGPIVRPYSGTEYSQYGSWLAPSWQNPMGTDDMGRDILANLMAGARVSLFVAAVATLISMLIGTIIGIVAGYCGKWVDVLLMRIADFFLSLPWLPLCMVLAAILGSSMWNIILVIGFTSWAGTSRIVRSQTLSIKEMAYVERTTSIGARNGHIMFKHILPNVFPIVFANTVLTAAVAITTETTLAFLGLGDVTKASWGMMLHYAHATGSISKGAWWYFLPAGICVVLVVLSLTLLGYAFDEILNPKLKER